MRHVGRRCVPVHFIRGSRFQIPSRRWCLTHLRRRRIIYVSTVVILISIRLRGYRPSSSIVRLRSLTSITTMTETHAGVSSRTSPCRRRLTLRTLISTLACWRSCHRESVISVTSPIRSTTNRSNRMLLPVIRNAMLTRLLLELFLV